jgi:dihydrofolate reductase
VDGRKLAIIVAIGQNGVIGRQGGLPWDLPEDRAHFHATTRGHVVIMGRRTWEETGAALPERTNVVVSSTLAPKDAVGAVLVASLDEALAFAWARDDEPFVIGGARLFDEAMPRVTKAYVTEVPLAPEGDAFFRFDARAFRVAEERRGAQGLRFLVYERATG